MKNIFENIRTSVLFIILTAMIFYVSDSNAIQPNSAAIKIKTAIDGLYNFNNGCLNKDAEMSVYLRNAERPYSIAGFTNGLIDKETLTGTFIFENVGSGQYYIVMKSNNTIETWSRIGGEFIQSGTKTFYDFSNGKEKAFGDNLKLEGYSKHGCIYTGDVNQDGFVNDLDVEMVNNGVINFTTGDVPEDLNGDLMVTLEDLMICYNNSVTGVKSMTPRTDDDDMNFTLKQNKPNPFNPTTQITIDVPKTSNVKLLIYDIAGREVAQLVNTVLNTGTYTYEWNASNFASGTYFYRVIADGVEKTMKMNLIK